MHILPTGVLITVIFSSRWIADNPDPRTATEGSEIYLHGILTTTIAMLTGSIKIIGNVANQNYLIPLTGTVSGTEFKGTWKA